MVDRIMNDPAQSEQFLERLLREAGHREPPPAAAYERVLAASVHALDRKLAGQRRRQGLFALAATVLIGLGAGLLLWMQQPAAPEPKPVARVFRVIGSGEARIPGAAQWSPLTGSAAHAGLPAHVQLRTDEGGGLALRLESGIDVRVDRRSSVELVAGDLLILLSGRVYVDTGASFADQPPITVVTSQGEVTDIGTQFEITDSPDLYRLRIREGQVELRQNADVLRGRAGEQVTLRSGDDGLVTVERSTIRAYDDSWDWVNALAEPPAVDGRPLIVALDWIARETGRELIFADAPAAARAEAIVLHGSIEGLAPLDALEWLLATTELAASLPDEGTILVSSR
jgi:ferric-dicitrate binding protein FerR (iron transport regulator)